MDLAVEFAARGHIYSLAAVGTITAARQMNSVLLRYVDTVIPADPVTQRQLTATGVWDPSADPRPELRESHRILTRLETDLSSKAAPSDHPAAMHLAGAAIALGAGHDLLNTHFAADHTARTDWANAIGHPDTRRALLAIVTHNSHRLATVLEHTSPALEQLDLRGDALDDAITMLRTPVRPATLPIPVDATLSAIPLRGIPPRAPVPNTPESIADLCRGITTDSESIRALASAGTASLIASAEWRARATGAAATMHSAVQIMALLVQRTHELDPTGSQARKRSVKAGQDACERVYNTWQTVRRSWGRLTTELQTAPPSALQQPLKGLVVRMRRILSSDPSWTIDRGNASPPKTANVLAPAIDDMPPIVLAIQHAVEAIRTIAEHDLADLSEAAATGRLLSVNAPRKQNYQPAPPADTRHLLRTYREAVGRTSASFTALTRAALDTCPPELRFSVSTTLSGLERRRDPSFVRKLYEKDDKVLCQDKSDAQAAATDGNLRLTNLAKSNHSLSADSQKAPSSTNKADFRGING
ncbi:hypothetical protein [Nonomuraea sp. NPDC046570]|uniref:hypothetical protein n=1 Tax=Nonomuraea sp. NPDC046570 TaxID=3155255 RepID=UPI003403D46A